MANVNHSITFESVYKFAPLDLTPGTREAACGMVSSLSEQVLGGEPEKLLVDLKWVWKREAWRAKKGTGGQTIGWRLVFGRSLLNDFANAARRGSRR